MGVRVPGVLPLSWRLGEQGNDGIRTFGVRTKPKIQNLVRMCDSDDLFDPVGQKKYGAKQKRINHWWLYWDSFNHGHLAAEFLHGWSQKRGDVIKWKHFPRYWLFVPGIHRPSVNSPPKGQWRGALVFSLICARINAWVNNREAGDLRTHRIHYDVIVMHNPLITSEPLCNCHILCL